MELTEMLPSVEVSYFKELIKSDLELIEEALI